MFLKRTYIIAEVGINHNGNFDNAKKLIISSKKMWGKCCKISNLYTRRGCYKRIKNGHISKEKFKIKKVKNDRYDKKI